MPGLILEQQKRNAEDGVPCVELINFSRMFFTVGRGLAPAVNYFYAHLTARRVVGSPTPTI